MLLERFALKCVMQETPANFATLSKEEWEAERLRNILLQISEEFRAAANPRDLAVRELQGICQDDANKTPLATTRDD